MKCLDFNLIVFFNNSFGPATRSAHFAVIFNAETCITNTSPQCNNFPLDNYYWWSISHTASQSRLRKPQLYPLNSFHPRCSLLNFVPHGRCIVSKNQIKSIWFALTFLFTQTDIGHNQAINEEEQAINTQEKLRHTKWAQAINKQEQEIRTQERLRDTNFKLAGWALR